MATIISKTSIVRCQNFLKVFLPLVPLGSAWRVVGPQLPRQHTFASGSPERPQFGHRAGSRGKGSRGCEERIWPWPRTRIQNLLEAYRILVREWMICRWFKVWFHFCMERVSQNMCTTILFCSLSSRVVLFCGPTQGSDFAPEFLGCPLYCDICLAADLITLNASFSNPQCSLNLGRNLNGHNFQNFDS